VGCLPASVGAAAGSSSCAVPPWEESRSTQSAEYEAPAKRPTRSKKCGVRPRFSWMTSSAPCGSLASAQAPCSSPAGPVNRTDSPALVVAVRPGADGVDDAAGDVASVGPVCSPPPSPQALSSAVALLMLRPRRPSRRSASLRLSNPSAKVLRHLTNEVIAQRHANLLVADSCA
jgi:hypothetical protein